VPRARSKPLGTGTLCREQKIQLSAQKKPAVQTYCAEREQSRLSAQPPTHGTEELCRELQKLALGTAETSRRKVTAATTVDLAVRCAESPLLALDTEICAECLTKALGKELKNIKFMHSNLLLHQPTPLKKHMVKFHIKIDIYFVFKNFISF
jgi:hypothetical protein